MQTLPNKQSPTMQQIVEQIINAGQMTRQEYLSLATILLASHKISAEDRSQINRIFDYIQTGRLRLVD